MMGFASLDPSYAVLIRSAERPVSCRAPLQLPPEGRSGHASSDRRPPGRNPISRRSRIVAVRAGCVAAEPPMRAAWCSAPPSASMSSRCASSSSRCAPAAMRATSLMLIRWPGLRVGALSQEPRRRRHPGVPDALVHAARCMRGAMRSISIICARALARYDQVMMSDVRDVVFQRNPFEGIDQPAMPLLSGERLAHHRRRPHQFALGARLLPGGRGRQARHLPHQLQRHHHRRHRGDHRLSGAAWSAKVAAMPLRIYRADRPRLRPGDPQLPRPSRPRHRRHRGREQRPHRHHGAGAARRSTGSTSHAQIHGTDGRLFPICHQYDRFPDILKEVEARFAEQ